MKLQEAGAGLSERSDWVHRDNGYRLNHGRLQVRLAKDFASAGVERAVAMAYEHAGTTPVSACGSPTRSFITLP